jgi:putative transposase
VYNDVGMSRRPPEIKLTTEEETFLRNTVQAATSPQREVLRARIVLLAAEGKPNVEIQEALRVSKPVVVKWRRRFSAARLNGLRDEAGRGRKRRHDAELRHRIAATACSDPPASVGTHWSVRTLAKHLGVSASLVHDVLSAESIKPHRFRYWKTSDDPEFESKMLEIVGLYLNPPENAVVLSADEKTSIQALDRTQPLLPLKPHLIERRSHDYKRHGTTSLLAALEVHSGEVHGQCIERNNSRTFIAFLRRLLRLYPGQELHVIVDNGSSHKSKETRAWVGKQKRLHLHYTPTHGSWLNQIEIWFGILTRKIVRRGIFKSREELVKKLLDFIESYNREARPFQWTYTGKPLAK